MKMRGREKWLTEQVSVSGWQNKGHEENQSY